MINFGLTNNTYRPIGLDIGHSSIKMIQLMLNGDHLAVHASEQIKIDPEINSDQQKRKEFITASIRRILEKGNFQGKNTVSCLPSGLLKITSLRTTEAESEKTEQILKKEVIQRFGLNPDLDAVNYLAAGNVRQGKKLKMNSFCLRRIIRQ